MNEMTIITVEPGSDRPPSQAGEMLALLSISADFFPAAVRKGEGAQAFVSKMLAHSVIIECRSGGNLKGAISFYANDTVTRRGFITFVAVDPEFRGHGVARLLVVAAVAYLKRAGFAAVSLKVQAENVAAIALYRSSGFATVAESAGEIEMTGQLAEPAYAPTQPFDHLAMAKGTLGPCL